MHNAYIQTATHTDSRLVYSLIMTCSIKHDTVATLSVIRPIPNINATP